MTRPKVISVNMSESKGTMKYPIEIGHFKIDCGLEKDAHSGPWHRQVSLLAMESIEKMNVSPTKKLWPGNFGENLTTEGIVLYELPIGTRLKVGDDVTLEVTQIGKECHASCEIRKLIGDCVMPREGIFTKVITEGFIKAGDEITIEE